MADETTTSTDLAYADTLWKAADVLRGQIDAAEYKHVVLGLLFLKYISDAFEARREALRAELEAEGIAGPQRRSVRRLLAKYGYPPDLAENATQLVLRQAELSTSNGV